MTTTPDIAAQNNTQLLYRAPRVNILETPSSYVIEAEMPGVKQDDIDVHVEDKTLTLTGRRDRPEGRRITGRRTDGYRRAFSLGDAIDHERVEARASHGILTVTLHKVPEVVPRKIPVSFN